MLIVDNCSHQAFQMANHHSIRVRILIYILPILAIGITGFFIGTIGISIGFLRKELLELSVFKERQLVMDGPQLSLFNSNNRRFDLVAKRAVQDLDNPELITLEDIDATVPLDSRSFVDIEAIEGIYEAQNKVLRLQKKIVIKSVEGMYITLKSALLDIKKGSLTSNDPLQVLAKKTQLNADSVQIEENGNRILFKKNIKMTIR
ncbi:LPS export ABC transporter periplasmic protein LptC [Candidatus Endowatersipora endosymbiont of Watersipora subatra]|uniref:LPS export ABC transporter periplasmic protein LptC n=1 Tax=Candidatus Endowatersipora endosymbiont of Watersipora subatra TaxID=3077946 RepID=UPI00312C9255